MRKMFAFLMALAMTVQLVMPAWADVAQEETAETVATEEAQGATEEAAEEPTEEVPEETEGETGEATEGTEAAAEETEEETTEAVEETTEPESAPTEAPAAKVRVRFACTPENLTLVVYPADGDVDQAIEAEADGSYLLAAGEYAYLAGTEGYVSVEDRFTVADEECQVEVALEIADAVDGVEALAAGVVASGTCGENLTWELGGDGTLRISGKGEMADYTYDDKAPWDTYRRQVTAIVLEDGVTSIGDYAFYFCSSATAVTIPDSVTSIGKSAFSGCDDLTSVTIPEGVTSIAGYAFSRCYDLINVTIPYSVTSIGDSAFDSCTKLSGIFVDDGNINYASVDGVLFNKELSVLIFYPAGHGSVYRIPEGVTSIGSHAFEDCSSLTNVMIPEGVTSIGDLAFENCSSLTNVTIPEGVTSIGFWGFFCCTSLTSVTIPVSTTSIGSSAFYNCTALKDIYYGGSLTAIKRITSNASIPQGCTLHGATSDLDNGACGENLAWALSANGVLTISGSGDMETSSSNWHMYEEQITALVLETGMTSIDNAAFKDCTKLTSVIIPEGVTSIGSSAFCGCSDLASVTIPKGVTSIGNSAFKECSSLTSIIIPEGVASIGDSAFYRCSGLASVVISEGVVSIGDSSFYCCTSLAEVMIPEGVRSIGRTAFNFCEGLTSVTIPSSVTSVGELVFLNCFSLKDIYYNGSQAALKRMVSDSHIPSNCVLHGVILDDGICGDNLTWILDNDGGLSISGSGTMENYSTSDPAPWSAYRERVTTVLIEAGVKNIGSCAFCGCSSLTSVTIPEGVTSIGSSAFYGCSGLTSVTIPEGVTSIGSSAFYGCSSLVNLTIQEGVMSIGDSAFYGCSSLTVVVIPKGVTKIEGGTFYGCTRLESVTLPEGLLSIEYLHAGAFEKCTSLKEITIPDGVTGIGNASFCGCGSLVSVIIPDSVTNIGRHAFSDCIALKSISYGGSQVALERMLFNSDIPTDCVLHGAILDNGTCKDGLTWVLDNDGGLTISGNGAMGHYSTKNYAPWYTYREQITAVVLETGVTSIGSYSFQNCVKLTSVTIPEGVTGIGDSAFSDCSSLSNVTIPEGVTNIGGSAFSGCSSLSSVTIPESVTSIGDSAFFGCSSLVKVTVPKGVAEIKDSTFSGCSSLVRVEIPISVTRISNSAFSNCTALKDIYYGGSLGAIKRMTSNAALPAECTLHGATSDLDNGACGENLTWVLSTDQVLTISGSGEMEEYSYYSDGPWYTSREQVVAIVLEPGVTSIGDYAFNYCNSLTSVTIPDSVTNIGSHAFYDCTALKNVYYSASHAQWSKIEIGSSNSCLTNAFIHYADLSDGGTFDKLTWALTQDGTLTISGSGTVNPDDAPWYPYRRQITALVLEPGVTGIADSTFQSYSSLTNVTIPDSVTSIGDSAFRGCSSLTSVTIPEGVTNIGNSAFYECNRLANVTIPGSVASIGSSAFYSCGSLTNVTIQKGVANIGDSAFYDCNSLTSVTIPGSVTSIDSSAFYGCGGLTDVTIQKGVTSIGGSAFEDCRSLASVIIPESVISIGNSAFYGCKSLASVAIMEGVTSIGSSAFYGCSSLTSITIPEGVTRLEKETFYGCTRLESVTLPEGFVSIADRYDYGVFQGCISLKNIVIPDSLTSIGSYAFSGCRSLASVSIPASVTTIGYDAFYDCRSLTDITFAHRGCDTLTIGNSAFDFSNSPSTPLFTVIHVPNVKTMHTAIKNYSWSSSGREPGFVGDERIAMTAITLQTKDGKSAYEAGIPVEFSVTVEPVDASDNYTFSIVSEKSTANAYISQKGILTTLSTGTVTVRAQCVQNPAISDEITVTILQPTAALTSLTVTTLNDYPGDAEVGKPVQMVPVFTPANAAERTVTWSVENGTGTATIDENGLLTPLTVGTVTVYAMTPDGVEGSCTVNIVRYAEEVTILLNGKEDISSFGVGENLELSFRLSPEDTTTKEVVWSVTNRTGWAKLYTGDSNNRLYGTLEGKQAGTVILTATAKDSKKVIATKELTITDSIRSYALSDGSGNLYYNTETGWITGADENVKDVVIPAQIDDVEIVGIAPYVFADRRSSWVNENKTLRSVSIPATVEEIGESAFERCTALSTLRFAPGSKLTTVGENAFSQCSSITTLTIPDGARTIGKNAFAGLSGLKRLTMSGEVDGSAWFGDRWFSLDSLTLTGTYVLGEEPADDNDYDWTPVPAGRNAKKVVLSEGITEIGDYAFGGCGAIERVVFPLSLKSIGTRAFASCSSLTEAALPDELQTIGAYAFRRCEKLSNVTLTDSIQFLGQGCFERCVSLQLLDMTKVPDIFMEKTTCLTGMVTFPNWLVRATNGKAEINWDLQQVGEDDHYCGNISKDRNQQWYLFTYRSGKNRIVCADAYTGARGSKLIEIKTGTLIRPSDTGYLVSGSKLALSAWSMPEEKKTSVWWSLAEGGSNYASIDSKGVLTARTVYSAQQVTVIAQPYDGSEQVTKTIWILPKTTGLGLLLDGGPLGSTLNVDQAQTKTLQLSAKVYPDGALQEVSWSSSNESVARVDETGLVTLAKPGTVVIQATTKDGSKLTAQVTLNVTYLDANSKLTLVGEVPQPGLEPGQTVQLTLWGEAAIEAENVVFSVPSNQSAMGSIDGSGLFTAGSTAGNVMVTAALKDDPLGRSATITIPVLPMQAHTVLAVPVLDGVGQVTQRDGIYEAIFRQTEVEGGYSFRLRVQAQNYQGQPLSGKFVYTTTDASIAKVSADGLVTVQNGAEGLCAIGVRAADALGTGTEVWVSVRDYSPRLESNKLTVNSALEEGCSLVLAASYGNDIENVFLSDGRFSCSWEEDKLTISAKESLKNGTYPMTLEVVCADNMYKYTLFVKVTKTLPKVTVKQTEKFNLFYQDSSAELKINVAGNLPYHYEFLDNTDFRLDSFDDEARLYFADPQNAPAKPDTKATLRLWLEGYREPVDVKLNIATVNKGPKVTTAVKASTLNTALTTSNTLRVRLNGPESGSMEAWSGTEGIEAVIDGCDLCLTLSEVKNTTATVYLRDTNWAQPIKLTHKITVTDKLPTLKAASALKLDSLFTQTEAWTELVLSQGNLSLVTAELKPVAKEGTVARDESDKLSVTYDPDACLIVARIADPDKAPKVGTYSFNCTGILENGGEIPGGVVKVTVVAAKPKVKLSASSVKLNKALDGWERVEIPVTVTGNNRVVDFMGLPEGMTYNENTGKLTVMLSEETASGGSYGLCPVVESNETGQRVTLPTKVSFKVQVYTSDKLAVSLSAKGKLNTLDPESSIAYTVTKVSNCLNPVEGVSLEGPDGDKFQAELDTTSAKPVVRLQMLPGQSYATNVGYKVRFRSFVAGREVLSPMQTVKLTQAALKVTAPKSLVYFQAQTGILRFSLAANAPIGEVALSAKTAPELLTALGEDGLRFDGSQLELSVTNPAALKAGKSYTLQLEVTPEYNAENVKPTLVKLTVKVMK